MTSTEHAFWGCDADRAVLSFQEFGHGDRHLIGVQIWLESREDCGIVEEKGACDVFHAHDFLGIHHTILILAEPKC